MRRGRPLRQVSLKRAATKALRDRVVARAFARDRWQCQARALVPEVECSYQLDPHERIPRSVWPDGIYDLDNIISVCRAHHRWIGDHPDAAHELGLHGYAHEREQPMPDEPPVPEPDIRNELRRIGRKLAKLEEQRRALYDERLAWWQKAVSAGWTQQRIADASLVKVNAVTQTLHRARQANPQEGSEDGLRTDAGGGALSGVPDGGPGAG